MKKSSLILLAPGFEECEGLLVIDLFRRAGLEIVSAAVGGKKLVPSLHGIPIPADLSLEEISAEKYDLCILPGGMPGVENLIANTKVRQLCTAFAASGKRLAAVCGGPAVLGAFGLLKGRRVTVFPGLQKRLTGAVYDDQPVITDGKITTGRALGSAVPFALELIRLMAGEEAVSRVKQAIVWKEMP